VARVEVILALGAEDPRDETWIDADPPLRLVIPAAAGEAATAWAVVHAAGALPMLRGLVTVLDLPPGAVLGGRMLDRSLVGRESDPVVVEVEKGMIRRLAEAIGDANPIHVDEAAARAGGFASLVARPPSGGALHHERFRHSLDLGTRSLLLGEESIEYAGRWWPRSPHAPLPVADVQERSARAAHGRAGAGRPRRAGAGGAGLQDTGDVHYSGVPRERGWCSWRDSSTSRP